MNAETVRVNLRYERAHARAILRYARTHDIRRSGRYEMKVLPRLNIWTHSWNHPACKAESTQMFGLEFDWGTASLMSVTLYHGFGWNVFLDELARLERAAIGSEVYGKRQRAPKT